MADDRAGALEEHQRLFLLAERQLLRVVGVVQAERDDRADVERRQPDDGVFGDDAAVGQLQAVGVRRGLVNGTAVGHPGALHACGSIGWSCAAAASVCSRRPRPSISIADALAGACGRRTVRRAEQHDVAGRQRHEVGDVGQQPRQRADALRGVGALHQLAIDEHAHGQRIGIADRRARHGRADHAAAVERLEAHRRTIEALVRHAEVVDDHVARHERLAPRAPPRGRRCGRSRCRGWRRSAARRRPPAARRPIRRAASVLRGFTYSTGAFGGAL